MNRTRPTFFLNQRYWSNDHTTSISLDARDLTPLERILFAAFLSGVSWGETHADELTEQPAIEAAERYAKMHT